MTERNAGRGEWQRSLVWTAPGTGPFLRDLPRALADKLEIVEIPADPLADPRLPEVRVLIPPLMRNRADAAYDLRSVMAQAKSLEYVQALSAGVDGLIADVPEQVTLCTVRGAYDDLMAELLLAGILACYKEIPHYAAAQARGAWEPRQVRVLSGARVLFVGYGSIARTLERYLEPFRVEVKRIARRPRSVLPAAVRLAASAAARPDAAAPNEVEVAGLAELSTLLPSADIVVVLTPLTDQTLGLVDDNFLSLMQPGALLVNGARGLIVETEALLAATDRGKVRAFLDVTDPEPLAPNHPLWSAPGVFITPHIGSLVPDNRDRAFAVVRANLGRWVRGEPLENIVDGEY
ncbi:MAG TPA: NAD(P)-dependent oxidoreductase [Actinocrinis sp.]|nr:NAD(P)-dependent oxidoreductase [Actinocrinis sp.]